MLHIQYKSERYTHLVNNKPGTRGQGKAASLQAKIWLPVWCVPSAHTVVREVKGPFVDQRPIVSRDRCHAGVGHDKSTPPARGLETHLRTAESGARLEGEGARRELPIDELFLVGGGPG